ncbi:MAG TPA: M15 family metallopeptidase [Spirochaetota bacterium]|mgnify:CR=1 FL=1|nr:M15 family metallopeptidase [Spirochaetota bacterium]HOM38595.1 M15 family metallopeptidase [Spirochaetota bacterium]HPQ49732.1 M15 family metallopeptidase [Spirochaetota bacterium]
MIIANPFFINPLIFLIISIQCSYHNSIISYSINDNYVVLSNREKIAIVNNNVSHYLTANDILSIFSPIYIMGKDFIISDAGRTRPYYLFNLVYGKNKEEIEKNLVDVNFLRKKLKFNKKNNAALNLQLALNEIEMLIKKKPEFIPFVKNAQTYNYRLIKNESVLSAHSYGIAIDFVYQGNSYWIWDKEIKTNLPYEIIEIMEKYGFIWGGKWEHFDTMHFEYRPEFLFINKIIRGSL